MRLFVAGNLWADAGEAQANSSLRSTVWRLQEKAHVIDTTSTHLSLAPWVRTDVGDAIEVSRRLIEDESPPEPEDVLALSQAGELLPV